MRTVHCHSDMVFPLQIESYSAPDPMHPDAHPLLDALHTAVGDWERYHAVACLIRRLLHPTIGQRATVHDALASELFA